MRVLLLLGLCLQAAQDDQAELIRRLRSDKIEERDAAARKLTELGKHARSKVEELLRDPDAEVARRAKDILRDMDVQEELRLLRELSRRRSADVRNVTLEQAAEEVFGGFRLQHQFRVGGADLGITTVTLKFKDAGFWEALDLFCGAAGLRHEIDFPLAASCSEPTFVRPSPWPYRWDTLGDIRIVAGPVVMGGNKANHGDVTTRICAVFAPWAVPKKARIVDVRLAGQALEDDDAFREFRGGDAKFPRQDGKLTFVQLWRGKDCVKRDSLQGAAAVTVEGTLLLPKGEGEVRLPFTIPGMPVPPVPKR